MDQHRHRDARVGEAVAGRAIGLLGAAHAHDDRVDRFEVARVRGERDLDLPRSRRPCRVRAEVVLDVAGAAFRIGDDGVDRPLALELAQHVLVRLAERVHDHAQPAAVRHAEHDAVRAVLGRELDRFVEQRDERVETLDGELLLAEEGSLEVALEDVDLGHALEQLLLLLCGQRLSVGARLDHVAEPDALLVVGDVLDLVRHRPAVRLAQRRQRLGERLAGDVDPEQRCGDLRLELGRQRRLETLRLERRIADGLRTERVEPRGEVAVRPVRLDQRHRGRDTADEQRVRRELRLRLGRLRRDRRRRSAVAVLAQRLEQAQETGVRGDELAVAALEQPPPLRRDGFRVLEVLVEERARVAGVEPVDVEGAHTGCCSRLSTEDGS